MSVPPLGYGFRLTNTPLPPLQEVLENLFTVEIPMTVTFRGVNSRQSARLGRVRTLPRVRCPGVCRVARLRAGGGVATRP